MSNKSELLEARESLACVLDAKLPSMPEWKALRAIDRALQALNGDAAPNPKSPITPKKTLGLLPSYTALADKALTNFGHPITTLELIEFIAQHRTLRDDPEKVKVSITSTLSKDARFQSVAWKGGRAWWYADMAIPTKESA